MRELCSLERGLRLCRGWGVRAGRTALLTLAISMLLACNSVDTLEPAPGQGLERHFGSSYESVYDAARTTAKRQKLKIAREEPSAQRLLLTLGLNWWDWGQHIGVFFEPDGADGTRVQIVTMPRFSILDDEPSPAVSQRLLEGMARRLGEGTESVP